MKIWLDDIRTPPDDTWTWCKTAYEAIGKIISNSNTINHISFDHDLGYGNSGYWVACQIEKAAHDHWLSKLSENDKNYMETLGFLLGKISWDVHSANPVGRRNIEMAMRNAEKYWNKEN